MPAPTAQKLGTLHPFTGQDVPWLLKARAENRGDHPFLVFVPFDGAPVTWTYAAFHEEVQKIAAGLADRGVSEGDFVLLHMGNCPEFLLTWHACSRLGAVVVTTNIRSAADELSYYIGHCGARVAITQPNLEAVVREAGPDLEWVAVTETDLGAAPETPRSAEAVPFEDLRGDASSLPDRPADANAFNSVQYTSGTTSRPKGVVWTHANALWGARQNALCCAIGEDDIGHAFLPLFHTNALSYSHLATLWAGATLVLQPSFSASRYWDVAVEHKCTWGIHIAFSLRALFGKPVPPDHSFHHWGLGAVDPQIVLDALGVPCIGWFGMTETISLPIISNPGLPGREMSMGLPAPGYDIEVRREDGTHVAFGESGRLFIRGIPGLSLFQEYLNNEEATAAAFDENGWFDTGDLVTPFEDGHIAFDGRDKDMLRIGAENVSESEIERVIAAVPGVMEVAVVGKPDPMLDEVAVAFVIPMGPSDGLEDRIMAACTDTLADFKVPRDIILVDVLPRVTLEKVDKKELRRRLKDAAES